MTFVDIKKREDVSIVYLVNRGGYKRDMTDLTLPPGASIHLTLFNDAATCTANKPQAKLFNTTASRSHSTTVPVDTTKAAAKRLFFSLTLKTTMATRKTRDTKKNEPHRSNTAPTQQHHTRSKIKKSKKQVKPE
jgi:hypothetical protein